MSRNGDGPNSIALDDEQNRPLVQTIALDLNHWIALSRTYHGKPGGASHEVLHLLLDSVRCGQARLPLSFLNLVELLKHSKHDRRVRLAEVLDLLANGWYMASWPYVLPQELARAVAVSLEVPPPHPPDVVGRGFLFGLDPQGRQELQQALQPGSLEKLERIASLPGAVLDLIATSEEHNRLKQNTSIAQRSNADAAALEESRTRHGGEDPANLERLKLAQYTLAHQEKLAIILSGRGLSLQYFFGRGERFIRNFWSNVPSLDVDLHLSLYRDRQWSRKVQPNDFADLGQLVLAIPYCSVVVTERFWSHAIRATGLAERYEARVVASLEDLAKAL